MNQKTSWDKNKSIGIVASNDRSIIGRELVHDTHQIEHKLNKGALPRKVLAKSNTYRNDYINYHIACNTNEIVETSYVVNLSC